MAGKVALVTGGSRGVGRGIAVTLGAAGWTVWITGRSSRTHDPVSHLPGTVEETAEQVMQVGGPADPDVMTLTGRALTIADLASRYAIDVTT